MKRLFLAGIILALVLGFLFILQSSHKENGDVFHHRDFFESEKSNLRSYYERMARYRSEKICSSLLRTLGGRDQLPELGIRDIEIIVVQSDPKLYEQLRGSGLAWTLEIAKSCALDVLFRGGNAQDTLRVFYAVERLTSNVSGQFGGFWSFYAQSEFGELDRQLGYVHPKCFLVELKERGKHTLSIVPDIYVEQFMKRASKVITAADEAMHTKDCKPTGY